MKKPSLRKANTRVSSRPRGGRLGAALVIVVASLGSCLPGAPFGPTGTIRLTVSTTLAGEFDALPAGYTAFVQDDSPSSSNRQEKPIAANGTVDFSDIGAGFQVSVGVTDLPPGCQASAGTTSVGVDLDEADELLAILLRLKAGKQIVNLRSGVTSFGQQP